MNLQEAIAAYKLGEYDKALEIFAPMAEQGDPVAQAYLGEMCRYGAGVEGDAVEAVEWFRKAAEQGYGMAQHNLGVSYFEGEGVQQDYVEALKWFRKAVEGGCEDSLYQLGRMYSEGIGVEQDEDAAARLFCKGAEFGVFGCISALADLYKRGVELKEDGCAFMDEVRKAAAEGDPALQRYLGLKEYGYRVYFNKMTILIFLGLLAIVSLALYDWVMIENYFTVRGQKINWIDFSFIALLGLYVGGWLSRIRYQIDLYARVSGIPFPAIFWEPRNLNRDDWLCFEGLLTLVSALLNSFCMSLVLLAIFLRIPTENSKHLLLALMLISSLKFVHGIRNR